MKQPNTKQRQTPLARNLERGCRLVPYVEGLKRGLTGVRTLPLSCANMIEVQVNLDGRIHPELPRRDAWP
jgi:hypothetical protein